MNMVMPQLSVGSADTLSAVRMTALRFPPVSEALLEYVIAQIRVEMLSFWKNLFSN